MGLTGIEVYLHWAEVREDGILYHMNHLAHHELRGGESLAALRLQLYNILDWGLEIWLSATRTYPKRDLRCMGVWQKWIRKTAVAIYVAEEKSAVEIPEKGKLDIRSFSIHFARGGLPTDRVLEIRWLTIRYRSNIWPGTWERKANRFAPLMPLYYSMRRLLIHCNVV